MRMKNRLAGRRLMLAVLLAVMIFGMFFFPMLKGSSLGSSNMTYIRSIGSVWRTASYTGASGSVVGAIIWMILAIILAVFGLVLVLIPDIPKMFSGTVSLIGSTSVVLLLLLMLASDGTAFENWGELAPAFADRSFGIGFYLVLLSGLGVIGLSSRLLSAKTYEPEEESESDAYEPEPQTVVYPEEHRDGIGTVVCLTGRAKGSSFRIPNNGSISLGRDPDEADIVVETEYSDVSRCHCIIRYDSQRRCYLVKDVSKNGTSVSRHETGERIALPGQTEVEVRPGSVLHIGKGDSAFRLE